MMMRTAPLGTESEGRPCAGALALSLKEWIPTSSCCVYHGLLASLTLPYLIDHVDALPATVAQLCRIIVVPSNTLSLIFCCHR
ncbi:Hypothetical protein NTJ_08704 [Nesidiocoris tenuis]|uniref:Uncharacterized protein n=1 Tax=Nesidiocoris tenuis TaxID=355587 RepID=A0ABN7AYA7_9HEMI|nr:Hypothetical protein NTJ_08704 [Nesidiocoris tenuis]